ncbi:regulator, partial [Klebsiella pneumoniae]|nr:regulator [Klebsiella pneumoniae]
ENGEVVGSTIEEQAEQVMKNISAILEANNIDFNNVIKTKCFLADIADFTKFNEIYAKYFISNPARSCVAVRELPKSVLCEVEVIAHI